MNGKWQCLNITEFTILAYFKDIFSFQSHKFILESCSQLDLNIIEFLSMIVVLNALLEITRRKFQTGVEALKFVNTIFQYNEFCAV